MNKTKKFKAPNGSEDLRVVTMSGHITIIGQEYKELPEFFWSEAYSQGALSEDMTDKKTFDEAVAEKAAEVKKTDKEFFEFLKEQLKTIYDNPTGQVDKFGNPIYRRVVSLVKKPVKKELIQKAWGQIVKQAEKESKV